MELSEWSMVISTSYGCIRTPHYAGDAFLLKVWEYLAASPSPGTSPGRAIAALSRTRQMSLINYITQVQFEFGAIDLLQQECDRLGIRHPLIVTDPGVRATGLRSEEHTYELQSLMRISYAVFCLKKKK